ncbi:GAF domain-containing protein [Marinobacter fonticola]|uniref:GAF domain-containing protein n=1 Tax=Marinobacter fonticola TaxID=2603215 RepID=UPI0011E81D5D|nr:GAF domain-containing protein [Marinobacter fonticola]
MKAPLEPADEAQRLEVLRALRMLDTPIEERFERITRLAQKYFGVSIAAITLVDEDRQWFKSIQGLATRETERRISFCGHVIVEDALLVIDDASRDERFADNPLVAGHPHIRFYAGVPLRTPNRTPIGTLCIIDDNPRDADAVDFPALQDLAALAEREFSVESPANRQPMARFRGGPQVNLLDEVTGLWNWDGFLHLLEESTHRAKLIGGDVTLVWVRTELWDSQVIRSEVLDRSRQAWVTKLLSAVDFFDTVAVASDRDFLLMINESDRAQLLVRLGRVASNLSIRKGGDPGDNTLMPDRIAFAAIKSIDVRMAIPEILEQLEAALPPPDASSGTLTLIQGSLRSQLSLL